LTQNFDGKGNVGNTITSRQESPVGEVWLLFVALISGTMYVTTGHGKYFLSISCLLGMSPKARLWIGLKAKD
jgi:H+/gluconate symporter-like permease